MTTMLSRTSAAETLAKENPHPRDTKVVFTEEDHVYTRVKTGQAFPVSVTGLLGSVDPEPFDAEAAAANIVRMRVPKPQHCHPDGTRKTAAELVADWDLANKAGTDLHRHIELALNKEGNGPPVGALNHREFQMFLAWLATMTEAGYEIFRTEWVIHWWKYGVAGSIDAVFRHKVTGKFMIVDWKRCLTTSSSGFSSAYGDKRLKAPLDDVSATKLNKWQLQVNVYREILEHKYGLDIAGMAMVVLHPNNTKAEEYYHERTDAAMRLLNTRPPKPPKVFPPASEPPSAPATACTSVHSEVAHAAVSEPVLEPVLEPVPDSAFETPSRKRARKDSL